MVGAVDLEAFVEAWQAAVRVDEVAARFGVSYSTAVSRAHRLRKMGVNLKRMPKRREVDVEALNRIVQGGR